MDESISQETHIQQHKYTHTHMQAHAHNEPVMHETDAQYTWPQAYNKM